MKKIVKIFMILFFFSFNVEGNQSNKTLNQPKEKYIVILNKGYKIKDIIGFDVIGNGSGIIKRRNIKQPLSNQNNLKKKLKRLENKQKQAINPKTRKDSKRIKRLKRKIRNFKKLKQSGKLDYKKRTYVIRFSHEIPESFIINSLKSHPAVRAISKDFKVRSLAMPNDPYVNDGSGGWAMEATKQTIPIRTSNTNKNAYDMYRSDLEKMWYLKTIQMDQVWNKNDSINGSGVVVAVIDSGHNLNHEDGQNIWKNNDELGNGKENNGIDDDPFTTDISNPGSNTFVTTYIDDYQGWDYVGKDNIPNDENGHGVHVAGTIAASGNNSKGIIGIAPSANIMVLKTLAGNGSGSMADIISAIDYAINQGADVINMSLGSDIRESVDLSNDAINIIQNNLFSEAKNQGIVVCIAAGNSRADHSKNNYSVLEVIVQI